MYQKNKQDKILKEKIIIVEYKPTQQKTRKNVFTLVTLVLLLEECKRNVYLYLLMSPLLISDNSFLILARGMSHYSIFFIPLNWGWLAENLLSIG